MLEELFSVGFVAKPFSGHSDTKACNQFIVNQYWDGNNAHTDNLLIIVNCKPVTTDLLKLIPETVGVGYGLVGNRLKAIVEN